MRIFWSFCKQYNSVLATYCSKEKHGAMRRSNHRFEVVFWFALIFQCSWAEINQPLSDVKFEIFENDFPDMRETVLKVMDGRTTPGKDLIVAAPDIAKTVYDTLPPTLHALGKIAKNCVTMFDKETKWKNALKVVAESITQSGVGNIMTLIKSNLKTVEDETDELKNLVNQSKNRKRKNEGSVSNEINEQANIISSAKYIRNSLSEILNLFTEVNFKKYPLVTAPLLIEVALMLAIFVKKVSRDRGIISIPLDRNNQLACQAFDLLAIYRERAVESRAEKLSLKYLQWGLVADILAKRYNPNGYQDDNSGILHCESGCGQPYRTFSFCESICESGTLLNVFNIKGSPTSCVDFCEHLGFEKYSNCIEDGLGPNVYHHSVETKENKRRYVCMNDYVGLVRQRVEEQFPVKLLGSLCRRKKRTLSGEGYLTIKLGILNAMGTNDGAACDYAGGECDPFVKVLINGNLVNQTDVKQGQTVVDLNYEHTTGLIPFTSKIRIEVYDSDPADTQELILEAEGDVQSFLDNPFRLSEKPIATNGYMHMRNTIQTYVFWEDKYLD